MGGVCAPAELARANARNVNADTAIVEIDTFKITPPDAEGSTTRAGCPVQLRMHDGTCRPSGYRIHVDVTRLIQAKHLRPAKLPPPKGLTPLVSALGTDRQNWPKELSGRSTSLNGEEFAQDVTMETKRPRSGLDRRAAPSSGRRASDPAPSSTRMESGLSATIIWTQPDGTRCWIARQSDRVIVAVSRGDKEIRGELVDSDSQALDRANAWRREYAVDSPDGA